MADESSQPPAPSQPAGQGSGAAPALDPVEALLQSGVTFRRIGKDGTRESEHQIIRFGAGAREYALSIEAVERTERVPMVTPVPRSPRFVRGVANLRGGVVCVLDLAELLEGEATLDPKCLLIVVNASRRVAFLSHSLPDFQRVTQAEQIAVPAGREDVYHGLIERDEVLIGVLDPSRLLDLVERRMQG